MASLTNNPFKKYKKAFKGKKPSGEEVHEMMKKKSFNVGKVKHTGKFEGKSNTLGHGGRAAQLKARGVPGGVIGNMARSVGAAPGGPNYHGKASKKRKSSKYPTTNRSEEGDVEKKVSKKRKGILGFADIEKKTAKKRKESRKEPTVGFHDVEEKSCEKCKSAHKEHKTAKKQAPFMKQEKKVKKVSKKHSAEAIKGIEKFAREEAKEKKKGSKKEKGAC